MSASYDGDANNTPASGACGDPGESVAALAPPTAFNAYVTDGNSPGTGRNTVSQFTVLADGSLLAKTPWTLPAGNAPVAVAITAPTITNTGPT